MREHRIINKIVASLLSTILIVAACYGPHATESRADVKQPEIHLPTLEEVKCESYCVYDKTADEIIMSMNPDMQVYPASMTKIMTACLALDYLDTGATISASSNALNSISSDSTVMGVCIGEADTVSEFLYGLMLPSGNDAANVLAEAVVDAFIKNYPADSLTAGPDGINAKYLEDYFGVDSYEILAYYSLSAFAVLMNYRAELIGLENTHFVNAHGLHDDNHYTTAADLAKIMSVAAENPDFCELIHTPTHYFSATNVHKEDGWSIVTNSNKILLDPWLVSMTPEEEDTHAVCVVGGKTGTTSMAGTGMTIYTINENGHELFTAVCGIPSELYSYQTRYVATVTAYGNLECWNRWPESVLQGTIGDYQSGNITDSEKPKFDALYLPGDEEKILYPKKEETNLPTSVEDNAPTGLVSGHMQERDLTSADDVKDGSSSSRRPKKDINIMEWVEEHMMISIIVAVLILLILFFIILIIIRSCNKRRRRKRKAKTRRPYIGEIIKD